MFMIGADVMVVVLPPVVLIACTLQPGRFKHDLLQHTLCLGRQLQERGRITQAGLGRAHRRALCVRTGRMLETHQIVERADKFDHQRRALTDNAQHGNTVLVRRVRMNRAGTGQTSGHQDG